MLAALGRKGLTTPAAPPLAQSHPCNARHQIEFGRPDVSERHRNLYAFLWVVVMRDQPLRNDVVLVEPEVLRTDVEGDEPLPGRQPSQFGDADLDHEAAAWLELRCNVL